MWHRWLRLRNWAKATFISSALYIIIVSNSASVTSAKKSTVNLRRLDRALSRIKDSYVIFGTWIEWCIAMHNRSTSSRSVPTFQYWKSIRADISTHLILTHFWSLKCSAPPGTVSTLKSNFELSKTLSRNVLSRMPMTLVSPSGRQAMSSPNPGDFCMAA